jgi:hypothetical protein
MSLIVLLTHCITVRKCFPCFLSNIHNTANITSKFVDLNEIILSYTAYWYDKTLLIRLINLELTFIYN